MQFVQTKDIVLMALHLEDSLDRYILVNNRVVRFCHTSVQYSLFQCEGNNTLVAMATCPLAWAIIRHLQRVSLVYGLAQSVSLPAQLIQYLLQVLFRRYPVLLMKPYFVVFQLLICLCICPMDAIINLLWDTIPFKRHLGLQCQIYSWIIE